MLFVEQYLKSEVKSDFLRAKKQYVSWRLKKQNKTNQKQKKQYRQTKMPKSSNLEALGIHIA